MKTTMTKEKTINTDDLANMANAIRFLSMDAIQKANSGHPGMPMGMADVATVLYTKFLKYDAKDPNWPDRDRFVLSAGHGSMLIYSLLYLTGSDDVSIDDIKAFRQYNSKTPGHPEYGHTKGVEVTTGPLGQGISNAVGMAIAEKMCASEFGDDICNHYTYVISGDGCLMEGISHEAISMAGHLKLSKLIVLFDDNNISIDGTIDLTCSDDQQARFKASGWNVLSCDGHNFADIENAIHNAKKSNNAPTLIACKTVIGKGAPNKQGSHSAHGAPLGDDEIAIARKVLGWESAPFEIPQDILTIWNEAGSKGATTKKAWQDILNAKGADFADNFMSRYNGEINKNLDDIIEGIKVAFSTEKSKLATRQSSQKVLEVLVSKMPELVGGSADLTGSVGTKTSDYKAITASDFSGNYIHYGVREHGMAAAMNGIALHGGYIPYGGTFLVFADYCRGSIRLSALMEQRVAYVLTHDSIGLGEDGPTHQPVETLASLRAIPNLNVYRPCDAVEMAETWQSALNNSKTPSALCLTRQGLPLLRDKHVSENMVEKGAYIIKGCDGDRDISILATGSEVSIAVEAAIELKTKGIKAAVISMPCFENFKTQNQDYQDNVLGKAPKIAIEAAVSQSWYQWLDRSDIFIGMNSFGASAPANKLFEHFGIITKAIIEAAQKLVK